MIPNVQRIVAAAIRNKRRLSLCYDGRPQARVVEPHLIYSSSQKTGTLLAYQVQGYHSSKRQGSFWRAFQLRKIDEISVSDELFLPRIDEGYFKVAALIKGETSLRVNDADAYMHFNPAIYGPPMPIYLATSPSLTMPLLRPGEKPGSV